MFFSANRIRGAFIASALLFAGLTSGREALADPSDKSPLTRAREAWDKGDLGEAEPAFREAITKGGLAPNEVVECYVTLGAARALLNKKDEALKAFRAAATLDSTFTVPDYAGTRAAQLASQAKKSFTQFGKIALEATIPGTAPAGKSFVVKATLDAAHAEVPKRIQITAKETTTGKTFSKEAERALTVEFEVPAALAVSKGTVTVHVDALDGFSNRIASSDGKTTIAADEHAAVAVRPIPAKNERERSETSGGFWSSPWPYVIGGVVLAGAGATVLYVESRPSTDVSVGQIAVRGR